MVADYEAAWIELQALVAGKTQHGREGLLAAMAEIAQRQRVPAGELSRLLRLYGVEVERARSIAADTQRDGAADFAGGLDSPADGGPPRIIDRGGHDGSRRNGRAAVRG